MRYPYRRGHMKPGDLLEEGIGEKWNLPKILSGKKSQVDEEGGKPTVSKEE